MLDGIVPPLLVLLAAAVLPCIRRLPVGRRGTRVFATDAAVAFGLVLITAMLELSMGRSLTYRNGPVRLWVGDIYSEQNSQQLLDPYSFTHVIHGAAFYGLTRVVMGPASVGTRAVVAIALESAWEAYENTDAVINRYRAATIALGYYGDSVVNSIVDILACLLGFVLTHRLAWQWTVAWVAVTEIALAFAVRDNLTLNILMLIHPIDAIRHWQMGG